MTIWLRDYMVAYCELNPLMCVYFSFEDVHMLFV